MEKELFSIWTKLSFCTAFRKATIRNRNEKTQILSDDSDGSKDKKAKGTKACVIKRKVKFKIQKNSFEATLTILRFLVKIFMKLWLW